MKTNPRTLARLARGVATRRGMASGAARERKERSGAHRFARTRTWEGGGSVRSVAKVFCSCSVMGEQLSLTPVQAHGSVGRR